jgi:heme exporter protein C
MKNSIWQSLIVGALMAFAGYAALFIAPDEKTMHAIQRIFYFHAPAGMVALIAFTVVFFANITYLINRQPRWDWLAVSGAEVGIAFNSVVLITGPIWAKPAWGIWWAWDARLTSTLVLWLLYISFLLLRSLMPDPNRRAVFSAIYGIFLFLDVPLVYFSIRIWRTQHPQPVILGGQNSGLDPTMRKVFWLCWLALMGIMVILIRQRYKLERARHEFEELRLKAEEQSADARESAPRAIRA